MGSRSSKLLVAALGGLLGAGAGSAWVRASAPVQTPSAQDRARATDAAARRVAERIRALQRESDALASQESTLLVELRKLEVERQLKTAELSKLEQELAATEEHIRATVARAAALKSVAETERPEVEARLVQIYKMGHAGYWRMLLNVDNLRSLGRAYRTAAALTRIDRDRVQAHARTLAALAQERQALEAKAVAMARLQEQAAAARAGIVRAAAARTTLIDLIDERRDLNAQLTGELEAAAEKLRASVDQLAGEGAATVSLPLRPFKGALAWPAPGVVVGRWGRQRSSRFGITISRNGVDISLGEGQPVRAVHEGTVAFADQFTGYGNLVIVDHGEGAHSLYGHLGALAVARGDRVDAGTRVGTSGRNPSGNPSLYFELRVDGKPVDPLQWLKKQP